MKYGLIGERLGHSFSKIIHERLGYEYELREVARGELDGFMRRRDFLGINVTIPYKEAVIPYLDFIDEGAREIGAVNTVVNRGGRLYGYNTDFYGMRELFAHAGIEVKGKKAAILGTGGTSKTAEAVLRSLDAKEIIKVGRSNEINYERLLREHLDTQIIVNTTPVGTYPDIFLMPCDISELHELEGVIDAVYNPLRTLTVISGRNCGAKAEGGLYMLVAQAVRASEIFLDKVYPDGTVEGIYEKVKSEKENIVLIGMPASGKSTVGRIVADRLGRRLVDTDELITERIGMSIKDFFATRGEAEFRRIEAEVVREVATESSLVIATGGGVVLRPENPSALRHNGRLYFIDRPPECLMPTEDRPLSSDREAMERRYKERYPIYCRECDERIDADCDAMAVAEKILEKYR